MSIRLTCGNCARQVREAEAKDAGWRYWSDGAGELLPFYPACAGREFGSDAPASSSAGATDVR